MGGRGPTATPHDQVVNAGILFCGAQVIRSARQAAAVLSVSCDTPSKMYDVMFGPVMMTRYHLQVKLNRRRYLLEL